MFSTICLGRCIRKFKSPAQKTTSNRSNGLDSINVFNKELLLFKVKMKYVYWYFKVIHNIKMQEHSCLFPSYP